MSGEVISRLYGWLESLGFDREACKVEVRGSTSAGGGRKLIAKVDIKTGDLLVSIPRKALLNRSTLAPHYLQAILDTLSANQLICLHLCKYRILAREDSLKAAEHPFAEYIESLPESFDSVPLQHAFDDDDTSWATWQSAGLIPSGLKIKADGVYKRCNDDYEAVCATAPDKTISKNDFVRAWLCVNSRCIWYDLHLPNREDNITLAPIIDMANHVPRRKEYVSQAVAHLKLYASTADFSGNDAVLTSAGDEIYFSYGSHDNYTLLAEYGFVLSGLGNPDANLDITEDIFAAFDAVPDGHGQSKRALLEEHSYLGEYHLIPNADGIFEPSFRTIIALNLLHVDKAAKGVKRWIQLVNGEVDAISEETSAAVHETLLQICGGVAQRADEAVARIAVIDGAESADMLAMLRQLWQSEREIATQYING